MSDLFLTKLENNKDKKNKKIRPDVFIKKEQLKVALEFLLLSCQRGGLCFLYIHILTESIH